MALSRCLQLINEEKALMDINLLILKDNPGIVIWTDDTFDNNF